MRADDVYKAGMDKDIRRDIDKVCYILGVLDERTARKHLSRFGSCHNDHVIFLGKAIPGDTVGIHNEAGHKEVCPDKYLAINIYERSLFNGEGLSRIGITVPVFFFHHFAYPCSSIKIDIKDKISSINLRSPPDPA